MAAVRATGSGGYSHSLSAEEKLLLAGMAMQLQV